MRYLVASDSAVTRRVLDRLLREAGHLEILNPAGLTPDLGAEGVDLAIVEWDTHSLRGLELVRQLRATPGLASARVLVISVRDGEDEVRLALEAGAHDYLLRPLNADVLAAKLASLEEHAAVA